MIKITDFSAPELDVFVRLTGAQLRNKLEPEAGIFIAESPTVIDVAMSAGCEPISFLTDERLIGGEAVSAIISKLQKWGEDNEREIPIYIAEREVLLGLTGFELTRGALCAMRRPAKIPLPLLLRGARRVAVLEGITDSTNIGAIFRSASALGIDAVLVTPNCHDPLSRRAVRVSMGTVFLVPWGRIGEGGEWPHDGIEELRANGFKTVAMALADDSLSVDDPILAGEEKLAIILGTEGTGLAKETIVACDYTVKIPMSHGVDSLNVACAGAVAFFALRAK